MQSIVGIVSGSEDFENLRSAYAGIYYFAVSQKVIIIGRNY